MRTRTLIILFFICSAYFAKSQMCPGGGLNYASTVTFDPGWIYGCNTGTSCNGGVNFDNRISCQPTTTMDACAPAPSCAPAGNNASNVWFRFYANEPTVTISVYQNSSFYIGIQAFEAGGSCGSLVQKGCTVSGGPSSGAKLMLSNLVPGQLYYFRIFGSSSTASQRTGIYCFCGTVGVQSPILSVSLSSLKAVAKNDKVELSFIRPRTIDNSIYYLEHSIDGIVFNQIQRIQNTGGNPDYDRHTFVHHPGMRGENYYRLKKSDYDGKTAYSPIVSVPVSTGPDFRVVNDISKHQLDIATQRPVKLAIFNVSGQLSRTISLNTGVYRLSTADLPPGIYIARNTINQEVYKFVVVK